MSVPAGAMHSFKADHNEINWMLVVEGDVAGWPDYKRSFPVIVRPANGEHRPMSAEPTVVIRLDGDGPVYRPGETLSGQYWIESLDAGQIRPSRSPCSGTPKARATRTWPSTSSGGATPTTAAPIDPRRPERFSTDRCPTAP